LGRNLPFSPRKEGGPCYLNRFALPFLLGARNDEVFPFYGKHDLMNECKYFRNHLKGSAMEILLSQDQPQTSNEPNIDQNNNPSSVYINATELDLNFILRMLPASDSNSYVGHEYFIG
jgi:hypothetical protein